LKQRCDARRRAATRTRRRDHSSARRRHVRRHHAHRIRQDAMLQRAGAQTQLLQDPSSGACICSPRPKAGRRDQLAELQDNAMSWRNGLPQGSGGDSGPEIRIERDFTYGTAIRRRTPRRTIRSQRAPVLSNPDMVIRDLPPPSALGEALKHALCDHRRAARVSRRLRQPSLTTCCDGMRRVCRHPDPTRCSCARRHDREPARAAERSPNSRSSWWTRGARRAAEKYFVFVNPPGRQPAARLGGPLSGRRASRVRVLKRNLQLIVFAAEPSVTENTGTTI